LEKILDKHGYKEDLDTILDICNTLNGKTVCVFAPAVKDIIASIIKKFPHEFEVYLKN
jgi:NADH-quinone oxidoreductase subunit F